LEVTQATITNRWEYLKEHLTVFYLNRVNRKKCRKCEINTFSYIYSICTSRKKYLECERKTFILLHNRRYGLQAHFEYSRRPNCWKSHKPQWRMNQNIAKKIWYFLH